MVSQEPIPHIRSNSSDGVQTFPDRVLILHVIIVFTTNLTSNRPPIRCRLTLNVQSILNHGHFTIYLAFPAAQK
jgi:hypothetical protein